MQITGTNRTCSPGNTTSRKRSSFVTFKPLQQRNPLLEAPVTVVDAGGTEYTGIVKNTLSHPRSPRSTRECSMDSTIPDIVLGSTTDEIHPNEALLAYEHHKRATAKKGMLRNSQKSPSFAVDEQSNDETELVSLARSNQTYLSSTEPRSGPSSQRSNSSMSDALQSVSGRRVPLTNRLKSLSVDDKTEVDDYRGPRPLMTPPRTHSSLGMTGKRSPLPISSHARIAAIGDISPNAVQRSAEAILPSRESQSPDCYLTRRQHIPSRFKLLSTKSFSMDVPGSEHADFSMSALSGGSSPGRGFAVPVDSSVSQPFRDETSRRLFEPASMRHFGTRTGPMYDHGQPRTPHFPGELHRPIPLDPRKNVGFGSPLKDGRGRVPYVTVPEPDCVPSGYRVPRNVTHARSQANGSQGMLFREMVSPILKSGALAYPLPLQNA
ncbi:hypothetical protein PHET_00464 [Paragonimus heterotremus]|uniref:Uncharacterized protein n=1 Tax=Paragonimus heterotremus TaxID=100268 RepID=A0A8J4WV97_9TREM|nr:hypothetical protein PHET_00464 [Paragonimus heterotremus]